MLIQAVGQHNQHNEEPMKRIGEIWKALCFSSLGLSRIGNDNADLGSDQAVASEKQTSGVISLCDSFLTKVECAG